MRRSWRERLLPLATLKDDELLVSEIYPAIQGESTFVGRPCVMLRLAGCNLRCTYCDTRYAFAGGEVLSRADVLERVRTLGINLVELTGGEPLVQPGALPLLTALCDADHRVLLETNGALDIAPVDSRVTKIVDIKTPSSGESESNLWSNVEALAPSDEVKFVVGDRQDYEWAVQQLRRYRLAERCNVLMGPVWNNVEAKDLAGWILDDRLTVRFQLQLHKILWGAQARSM
ncbi:MAG: 7-carboxy-7-deazaguanine synthase QueE [Deltaproteobacteria bacterium RIFOXYA12_FULL_58_15]|nr:MAG: 7-carboxy-7-deazaguanine synthase QueE [Deltaproteobacteria bacterium RIFOXYA12_FULL_58_15]OGR09189.1 MAG: 7-carboxy-7-deazaguanine synthase QueE [Deltaproteobacteria bacterium RIFOXYB12_FULL_58_9]